MALKLASGSYDGTIKFWDPSTGTNNSNQQIKLNKFNLVPNKIQVSQNKKKLIAGMHNTCKVYDLVKNDTILNSLDGFFKGNVTAVGFKKNQNFAYTACQDGFIRLFDLRKKGPAKTMKSNKPINCAVLHPKQDQIISGDEGGFFKIWDISNQKQRISLINDHQAGIRSISISKNGGNVIFADSKGWIQPFYFQKGQQIVKGKALQAHNDYILKIEIAANGKYLATCSADKKIKLLKIVDPQKFEVAEFKEMKGHLKWVWDCRFSCDSAYLISCSSDATLKLWGVQKGELMQTLKGHEKGVICLALNDILQS